MITHVINRKYNIIALRKGEMREPSWACVRARLIVFADGNSHAGPYVGQDEEGDVPECLWWSRLERIGEQQGSIKTDVRGGHKEDYGEPVERLLCCTPSVPGVCKSGS